MSREAGSRSAGKKIPILSLIVVFLFSLVFPNQSLFAVKETVPNQQQNQAAVTLQPLVKVVTAAAETQVTVASQSNPATLSPACVGVAQSGDVLQNAGLVNLDQPASCFSLEVSHLAFNPRELSVSVLPQINNKVVVAPWPVQISSASFSGVPFSPSSPALPLVSFTIAIGFFVLSRRLRGRIINSVSTLKQTLTLHQLQVLRC